MHSAPVLFSAAISVHGLRYSHSCSHWLIVGDWKRWTLSIATCWERPFTRARVLSGWSISAADAWPGFWNWLLSQCLSSSWAGALYFAQYVSSVAVCAARASPHGLASWTRRSIRLTVARNRLSASTIYIYIAVSARAMRKKVFNSRSWSSCNRCTYSLYSFFL